MQYSEYNPKILFPREGSQRFSILQRISREVLYDYYRSHTLDDTANYFGESEVTLSWLIKFYGIKKTKEEKRISLENKYDNLDDFYAQRSANSITKYIENYGSVENFYKMRTDKTKEHMIEKYGSFEDYIKIRNSKAHSAVKHKYNVDNISQLEETKEKKKRSLIEHYGSLENAYKERQEKTDKTLIEKYGSIENYRNLQQEKARKTYEKNYGVTSPLASKEIQEKIKEVVKNKYGVEYICMINNCVSHQHNSKPNISFEKLLAEHDLQIDAKEFTLGKFIYDFKIGDILVEINPFATHNINWSPFGKKIGLEKDYHQRKSMNAFDNNYRCIHVWDWDDVNQVIENIKSKNYMINNQRFGNCRKYIYDYKLKQLVNEESNTTVIIFDDGIILDEGEL